MRARRPLVIFDFDGTLGPAASRMVVDGEGGFLFFKKHLHAVATMADYRIVP